MRKVWRQMQREGFEVARCTVARLMRKMGLHRRQLRQRSRRDDQRALQSRVDPSARALAVVRGRRVRDPRMGRLVNNRRLLEPIGNIPPAEAEASTMPAWRSRLSPPDLNQTASGETGTVQPVDRGGERKAVLDDIGPPCATRHSIL